MLQHQCECLDGMLCHQAGGWRRLPGPPFQHAALTGAALTGALLVRCPSLTAGHLRHILCLLRSRQMRQRTMSGRQAKAEAAATKPQAAKEAQAAAAKP